MLYLVNKKTSEVVKDETGAVVLFNTNNEACAYAGKLKISCWIESEVYNPGSKPRKQFK